MIIRRFALSVLFALTTLGTAACGNSPTSPAEGRAAATAPKTADDVTQQLGRKITGLKLVKAYTAADDPNHMLGRPNGYTSKTAFADSRVPADQVEGLASDAVERGGSVEVYPDEAGAKARMDYIQTIGKSLPMASEYDYLAGPVLVRVSRILTPDQAKEYEAALHA